MPARKKAATRNQPSSPKRGAKRTRKDAIALLKADHELVAGLFERYEKTSGEGKKAALAQRICKELTVHVHIEEEIFYPAVRAAIRDADLMDEALVEHKGAKDLIAQIAAGKPGDALYDAKVKVLSEYIKHHVKEEHTDMFPRVRKTKLDLAALGARLEARKTELAKGGAPERKRAPADESLMGRMSRTLGIAGGS